MPASIESVEEYLARKRKKSAFGKPKPGLRSLTDGTLVEVITPFCPCPYCGHKGELCIVCDSDYADCQCCHEICS